MTVIYFRSEQLVCSLFMHTVTNSKVLCLPQYMIYTLWDLWVTDSWRPATQTLLIVVCQHQFVPAVTSSETSLVCSGLPECSYLAQQQCITVAYSLMQDIGTAVWRNLIRGKWSRKALLARMTFVLLPTNNLSRRRESWSHQKQWHGEWVTAHGLQSQKEVNKAVRGISRGVGRDMWRGDTWFDRIT